MFFRAVPLVLVVSSLLSQQTTAPAANPSGMYTFLKDGEFLQLTVEDARNVTGFISRYGDSDGDRGTFLNQFLKQGKLEGNKLTFVTDTVHAVRFEFSGSISRGPGKTPAEEAYYIVQGTLTDYRTSADEKTASNSRQVAFKSFPQDVK